jgi:hypothetical protein
MRGFVDRLIAAQSYIPDQHQMCDCNVINIVTLPQLEREKERFEILKTIKELVSMVIAGYVQQPASSLLSISRDEIASDLTYPC